jgi:hypothetical protein
METSFEVLFLLAMIVPPAAVVAGTVVLLGSLVTAERSRARDAAAAHATGIEQGHAAAR